MLVYVYAYFKYPNAIPLTTTTLSSTAKAHLKVFTNFGLPDQLVTNYGRPIYSYEFADYSKSNGILYSRSAPYYSQSNREAKIFVLILKDAFKSSVAEATLAKRLAF